MKTLKQFTAWSNTTKKTNKKNSTTNTSKWERPNGDLLDRIKEERRSAKERIAEKMKSHNNSTIVATAATAATAATSATSTAITVPSQIVFSDNSAYSSLDSYNTNASTVISASSLIVGGRDILHELTEVRDILVLLNKDVNMEEKYPKLKELRDAYDRQLAIYKTWDSIKETK